MKRLIVLSIAVSFLLFNVSANASSLSEGENPAPVGAILKQAVPPVAADQLVGPSVALIADKDLSLSDVEQKVLGTGKIESVTNYDIYSGTVPSLSELQTYDAVLVWGGTNSWGDTKCEELGNVLADYVDAGGGVVIATFSLGSNLGSWIPTGRFSDLTYWSLEPQHNQTSGHQTLGTIYQPDHPILADVYTFDGGTSSYRVITSTVPGAELIADWTDGLPLIATKDLGFARRADLNFYPPSSDVRSDFWDASTDGDEIMANALVWVSGLTEVTVTLTPDATTVERGGTLGYTVEVVNNTTEDQTFEYWSDVYLWTGEPYAKNPVFGPKGGTLPAGKTKSAHISHKVPNKAPLKTYSLCGRIGFHPDEIWDEDCFEFTVVEGIGSGYHGTDWEVIENTF
jgi:hypothetical protein